MVNSIKYFLKVDKNSANKIIVNKIFLDQINKTDEWVACRVIASKTKLLFKKYFILYQKPVKPRMLLFFIQFLKTDRIEMGR